MSLTYVVDSSLVVDALSAREGDEVLRQRLSAPRTLHAPHHLDVEVASTVRGLGAGQKITDHRGEQMLADAPSDRALCWCRSVTGAAWERA